MSRRPTFTPEENQKRIKMDKGTKYLVVEGEQDIPKFESALRTLTNTPYEFEPVFLGGKAGILNLLTSYNGKNFVAIVDKDFDSEALPKDNRLIVLSKYSIENFIYCKSVLVPFLANIVNEAEVNVGHWFDLKEWQSHIYKTLKRFLNILHFYQTTYSGVRAEWSDSYINEDGSWKVDLTRLTTIVSKLFGGNIPSGDIRKHTAFAKTTKDQFFNAFPGKLLIRSVYRFIKEKINTYYGNDRGFGAKITNEKAFSSFCTSYLQRHPSLRSDLGPAIAFLATA